LLGPPNINLGGIASSTELIYDDDIIYHADKTMRTLVDLGDTQVQALDELSKREKRSRAALIRLAIDEYLAKRHSKQEGDAFGLWGKRKVDGLVYQEKVRSEW
jgi:predicted transcriptional regulator